MSIRKHVKAHPGNQLSLSQAVKASRFDELQLREFIRQGHLAATRTDEGLRIEQRDLEKLEELQDQ